YDESLDQAVVIQHAPAMLSAGAVNGFHDPRNAALDGQRAGLAAVAALRPQDGELAARLGKISSIGRISHIESDQQASAHYVAPSGAKKKFVCLCEDVTEKD